MHRARTLESHTKKRFPEFIEEAKVEGEHKGYGKVILFGEHFVVYGLPAVVCAVREYTDCLVEKVPGQDGWTVVDRRPAVPGYIAEKRHEQEKAHDLVLKHLNIDLSGGKGIRITLGGPLVPTSGIGASASNVTALARALSHCYGLDLTNDQVNDAAFAGEAGYHGTPSGIDNTAATFGGLLSYRRASDGPVFHFLRAPGRAYLVVVSTGITASTKQVVAEVRTRKEERPHWWTTLTSRYATLLDAAVPAVEKGDWNRVGELMTANHALCQEMGLCIPELDAIVAVALEAGAAGAKMSGTGRGGIAVAMCVNTISQRRVSTALKKLPQAKFVWNYTIGAE